MKCHWDFVLGELIWLSKEMAKERKKKIFNAKQCVRMICKKGLDVESRKIKEAKREEKAQRSLAKIISKHVSEFVYSLWLC